MRSLALRTLVAALTLAAFQVPAWADGGPATGRDPVAVDVASCPPISVSPASLPGGIVRQPYHETLTSTGTPPFTFAVSAGALPTGLHLLGSGNSLYGCDPNGTIFHVDLTTGVGTPTGIVAPTGSATEIEHDFISGATFVQARDGFFYGERFDLASGAAIGGPVYDGLSFQGLEFVGSTLYGTAVQGPSGPCTLYTIDPTSGFTTQIGYTFTGPIAGLAYDTAHGIMYGINGGGRSGPANLLTINLSTGVATVVGSTGITAGSLEFGPDGNLYAGGDATNGGWLYRIDRLTGASTLIGPTGFSSVSGLTLAPGGGPGAQGILSGSPRAAGSYPFRVLVTDANGCQGTRDYRIDVTCPPITISPASLPPGTATTHYTQVLTADAVPPFNFYLAGGSMPPGLILYPNGALEGDLTTIGSYAFSIGVVDSFGCRGSADYRIDVGCGILAVSPDSLPNAPQNAAYHVQLSTTGLPPLTFVLQNGNLPQGLTLATDGAIDGTPTTVGAFGFTVSVTDANGCHGTHNYGITVFTCPLITVLPASMPDGLAGASYQQTLTADGAPPFVFSVSAGSLPPGLALASAGGGQVLYGCDRSGSIFTVDLVTGAGTPTGVHPPLGACTEIESDPAGIAFAQSSDGGFYGARFDLASGALIGSFVSDSGSFQGLEYVGATLYGTYVTGPDGPSTLATLDPVTGAATPIGPTGTGPVSGLAYDAASGTMYGINGGGRFGPGYLLTLDLTTGAATVVGPTGMTAGSLEFGPDGNLYAGGDAINGGRIYRIDRHTGFATQLGPSGFSSVTGLTLGPGFGPGPEATLSGVLRAAGSYTFTVTATDANGCRGDREYHINVACPVISISPATLPPGLVGVPYDQVVTTSGGTGPFTFSSEGFPPGMTVGAPDSGGTSARILGTPSAVGSYACAIHAVDADSCSADREYTLAVTCPPVALGPALLPDGAIGVSYRQVLTPTAGALPVTATLTAGSLPPGLSLSNDAVAAPGRGQGLATRTFPSGTRGPAPRRFTAGQRSIVSAVAPALSAANVLTPAATSSGPRILFALADYDDPDYRAAIAALTGGVVDYFNCAPDLGGSTPSLALLDSYDCVFTKPDFYYADRVLLGDELADYVDQGHTVILGVFCALDSTIFGNNGLGGRIMTPGYCPVAVVPGTFPYGPSNYAGDGTTCIHTGVSAYGDDYRDELVLQGDGVVDGHYLPDGIIAHAFGHNGRVIYSNGHGGAIYNPTGDWPRLIANMASCNPHPPLIAITGTPTQNGTYAFTLHLTDRYGCSGDQAFTLQVGPPLPMTFKFEPHDLNLNSKEKWVTGFLTPAAPRLASQIDVASIRLDDVVPVSTETPPTLEDHDHRLKVKFLRALVVPTLTAGDSVPVTVTGLIAGQRFRGTDIIKVSAPKLRAPKAADVLAAGSIASVIWDTPDGPPAQSVTLRLSLDDGATWTVAADGVPNTGSYGWRVPAAAATHARLEVMLIYGLDETGIIPDFEIAISDPFVINSTTGAGDGDAILALRPASPLTGPLAVRFSLADDGAARLAAYDVTGRQVLSREVGTTGPGWHEVSLGNLPAGIYVVRLSQARHMVSARVSVIR